MFEKRIIPILTFMGEDLVKTKNFKNPKYIGDPLNVIRIFNEKEVDELTLIDISKDSERQEPNFRYLSSLAEECNMPLTYGGKIRNFDDVDAIFKIGFEKVLIRSGIENNLALIQKIAHTFGSQSLVCGIDIKMGFTDESIDDINIKISNYIKSGAGEIFINDISKDGTLSGANMHCIKYLCSDKNIPLTWAGGFNSLADINEGFECGLTGVGIGAFFSFYGKFKSVLITYPDREILAINE